MQLLENIGYILGVTSEKKELPVITGAKTSTENLISQTNNQNRLCEEDLEKFEIVASIIDTAKNYEVDTYITKIDISEAHNIKLFLEDEGKIAHLGSCTDLNTRILHMKEIIEREKGINGEMFINGNLSEDRVYFRENIQ